MATTRDRLAAAGFEPEQPFARRSVIATGERGKKYALRFDAPAVCAAYAVDGYVLHEGRRCDKLVLVEPLAPGQRSGEVFVELKGRDVEHAIGQLEATLGHALFRPDGQDVRRAARIVAHSYPRNTGHSALERARVRFLKLYRCELRTLHSAQEELWRP